MEQTAYALDRGTPDATPTETLDPVVASEIDLLAGRSDRWSTPDASVPHAVAARALVVGRRGREARAVLDQAPPIAEWSARELASGIWALSRVGHPEEVAAASAALDASGADVRSFLFHDDVPLGPVALFEGVLAAASGDLQRGAERLREASHLGDERAPSWGARARLELVRVLHDAAADGDEAAAAECSVVRTTARVFYLSAGYHHQASVLDAIATARPRPWLAQPAVGVLVPGDRWRLGFGVQPAVTMTGSKGLRAIRYLIEHRGRRVPAVELAAALDPRGADRLGALREAIARKVEDGDGEGLRHLLVDDQVRTRVSKLIRRTIDRLDEHHVRLARHLRATIETGHSCAYVGEEPLRWVLTDGGSDRP